MERCKEIKALHEKWEKDYISGIALAKEEGQKAGIRNVAKQMKNKNMDCHITNINNNKYLYKPFSLVIDKFEVSGIKIRFKLKKEGLDTLPKLILDAINYLKCFPFFKIDKETKAILGKISLIGPFKDIKILLNNIKMLIITQLSKELVIKVLHPSANEIKDNINNMIDVLSF